MTPSELKFNVENTGSNFFSRSSMKFFGDTMKNYGVGKVVIKHHWSDAGSWLDTPIDKDCWELFRKHAVKHGLRSSAYFDCITFERIFPSEV